LIIHSWRPHGPGILAAADRAADHLAPGTAPLYSEVEGFGRFCKPSHVSTAQETDGPVRVCFDSRAAREPHGIGRYCRSLLAALRALQLGELQESHHPHPRTCDVYHAPWIDGALLRPPVPMVVTLHDLIPLKRRGEYLRTGVRLKLRYLAVQRATRVIVPTRAVARDAQRTLRLDPAKIAVIAEAAAAPFRPRPAEEIAAARERYGLPEHYLLWVGSLRRPDPRKRVGALVRTRRQLPLVLVGETGRWARELPGVILTGQVSDDTLAQIYSGAHALVFPSDDEGFGLPPVEALACGTPVVACDLPAIREVLGDRATLVDVGDLDGLISAAERARRPAPPLPAWSWEQAARATWSVYAQAAGQQP
jgi:glycosyltransferase involved in cell wall biosynthesis